VTEAIGIVETRAVYLLTNPPKTGRLYRRRGVVHQASAPGEAPASDSGALVNARRIDVNQQECVARLTFTSAHAPLLERGTRNMAPRPFARRALYESREQVREAIERNVAVALRG
jgi:hypothetical protein